MAASKGKTSTFFKSSFRTDRRSTIASRWIRWENLARPLRAQGSKTSTRSPPPRESSFSLATSLRMRKYVSVILCRHSFWFLASSILSTEASPSFISFSISACSLSCLDLLDFFNLACAASLAATASSSWTRRGNDSHVLTKSGCTGLPPLVDCCLINLAMSLTASSDASPCISLFANIELSAEQHARRMSSFLLLACFTTIAIRFERKLKL
mmetsp:Transcript_19007/g.42999  ORF Transcript_19007/g.42999 Transcript_19007/m.42999 type:complete len:212 (-) Transcript_19007:930-1565(-)